jgi:hypothetical protein
MGMSALWERICRIIKKIKDFVAKYIGFLVEFS